MKINFRKMIRTLSIAVVPFLFLTLQTVEASAKSVSGRASFGSKVGKCSANISRRKRTTVTCFIGGKKKKFSVQPRRSKTVRLKKNSKYRFRISGVKKSSSRLSFLVTAYKGRKKKKAKWVSLK